MGKYFNSKAIATMIKSENERRSSEAFFSSKEDNDNYFGSVTGQSLTIVGLENVPANGDIRAFNVVKFDDGHQMSTSKFFAARGLKWPVGGNALKLSYLASALERNTKISVVPASIKVTPMKRADGSFVGARGTDGNTTSTNDESKALKAVTYYFEEQNLPKVEMVDFTEKEEE